jgi:mannose-6-phosphate isomerase
MSAIEVDVDAIPGDALTRPLMVPVRPVFRSYLGGDRVRRFRGLPSAGDDHWTEEWIGSVIPAGNPDPGGRAQGLTMVSLAEGRTVLLRDVVKADPETMLGTPFVERHGTSIGFIVKMISLGQVGPVHAHPREDFARKHFGVGHGQAEAWILLGEATPDDPPYEAGIAFRPGIQSEDLMRVLDRRSSADMRALLERVQVRPGDAMLIRPAVPHYLGKGPLFIEVQEPSDFSVVPDFWSIGITEEDASLGLGWEVALEAIEFGRRAGLPESPASARQQPRTLRVRGETSEAALLGPDADGLFDVRLLRVADELEVGPGRFAIAVITAGDGHVEGDWGVSPVKAGQAYVMPATLGHRFVAGRAPLEIHRCMGPAVV